MIVDLDAATVAAYDKSTAFADGWHNQSPAVDLCAAVLRYFHRGGETADIGCGSGGEVAWRDALADTETLLDEQVASASSGKTIHRIVARTW